MTTPRIGRMTAPYNLDYGRLKIPVALPAGLRTTFLPDPSGGRWVLDEFPRDIFPPRSLLEWDATHYGITIPASLVEEI